MAKRPSNKARPVSTSKSGAGVRSGGARQGSGQRAQPQSKGARQSVAQARRTSANSNRTQLIIGGIAIVAIVAIVVIGLVINKEQNAQQGDPNYLAKASTATVVDHSIVIANGDPATSIDVYEDALCPICGEFEYQYGKQIAEMVDNGDLEVRLHMLDFLNKHSSSGDYSTRAAGALLAVAIEAGDEPGLVIKFHSALFDPDTQPAEGGDSDLSNEQLADLAISVGAPKSVKTSIVDGKYVQQAAANAEDGVASLAAVVGGDNVGTPTVLHDGAPVDIRPTDWLPQLVG